MKGNVMTRTIADKLTRKVVIHIDDEDWQIVVTHNVLIECEELSGLNLLTGDANLMKPSAKLVRALLYCCLRRAGAKYTIEEVGDLITPENLVMVQEGLLNAWAASMPIAVVDENPIPAAVV
jgi:hypothetical protein